MRFNLKVLLPSRFLSQAAFAQNTIVGIWKAVHDETDEARSIVEIFRQNNTIYEKMASK